MNASARIRAAPTVPCRPWPRHMLVQPAWEAMAAGLEHEPTLALLAMWADAQAVHALFRDDRDGALLPASVPVADQAYPALSPWRPAAAWFERAISDLWGHAARGGRDARPWLDHGSWEVVAPLAPRPLAPHPLARPGAPLPAEFLPCEAEGVDQIPHGPLPPGIAEAGQFRAFARGEQVLRLEARLGYLHKGIAGLMRGKSPRAAATFAARLAGDATVAHAIAFARAAEVACHVATPPRAAALRGVAAEAERIAMHLADLDRLARAAGAALPAARFQWHREAFLRAGAVAFGHRLMMDVVVPGGVAIDLAPDGAAVLRAAAATLGRELPELAGLCAGLSARLQGVAIVPPGLAALLAAGGPAGRASGSAGDLRRAPGYRPYHDLNVVPASADAASGDAAARLSVRLAELRESCRLLRTLLADLPEGILLAALPMVSAEGIGWAEGPRGDIWTWLRLEGGQVASAFPRDPGWLHLPLLEQAMRTTGLSDLGIALASFGLSHAGMDQ